MTLHIEYEASQKLDFDYEDIVKRVTEECIDYENCPYETDISVLFTGNSEIQEINKEFRHIDSPTDVLSFPAIDFYAPGDFSGLEESEADYFHPETGELLLGDIVISVDKAISQAAEYGHSTVREIAFLTAHSMFHLMGYDHMTDEEREVMEEKQNSVLEKLQILR